MIIRKICEDQYYVICDGQLAVLSLDEVLALLRYSHPDEQIAKKFSTPDKYKKEQFKWNF